MRIGKCIGSHASGSKKNKKTREGTTFVVPSRAGYHGSWRKIFQKSARFEALRAAPSFFS